MREKTGNRALIIFLCVAALACVPSGAFAQAASAAVKLDVFNYDFEKGDKQGWGPRGGVNLEVNAAAAHSGASGLATSNRSANWNGPALQVKDVLKAKAGYAISAFLRVANAPASASTLKLTMEEKTASGTNWVTVGEAKVSDDSWVQISGTYSYSAAMDALTLYAESSSESDVIYMDDAKIEMKTPPPAVPAAPAIQKGLSAIKDKYLGAFTVGAAVSPENMAGPSGELLAKHFNSIVAENAMKPLYVHPAEDKFFFDDADKIVAYARKTSLAMRYHTLLWHSQVPDWFFLDAAGKEMADETDAVKRAANKALLLKRIETHVTTIVSRYKDDIKSWDVVNEVIDPNGPEGMRDSKWYKIAGKDFVETAFRAARAAGGPRIKLYITDYGTSDPTRRDVLYAFVKELLAKGVPIDGIGHQSHISIEYPSVKEISDSIKLFAGLGLDNQITELDVSVYPDDVTAYAKVPQELLDKQGYRYKALFDEFVNLKDMISNVTFWGVADNYTWLHDRPIPRRDAPFAFDASFQAKPAYWGMVDPSKLPPPPAVAKPAAEPKLGEAVPGKPVIDGEIDAAWAKAKVLDVTIAAQGTTPATAKARAMWDADYVYVLMEVSDPVLNAASKAEYERDSIEVYLDENDAKSSTYQDDDAQYRVNFQNEKSYGSNGEDKRFQSAAKVVNGGYVIECAMPFKTTKGLVGKIVGFDAQVNDADATGARTGISKWNDASNNSYRNTLNWGNLKLLGN